MVYPCLASSFYSQSKLQFISSYLFIKEASLKQLTVAATVPLLIQPPHHATSPTHGR